jgi:hypothetical protein
MLRLVYNKKNKSITIPQSWNEVSCKQFLMLVKLLHSAIEDKEIASDRALHILSNKCLLVFLMISPETRSRCWQHVQWVFKKQNITTQLLDKYKGLYGPASEFGNVLMCEFHHTEMAYHGLMHGDDEEKEDALNELVAILFRECKKEPYDLKRNPDGDVRIEFAYGDIEWHKKKVKRWPLNIKRAILIWYDACREQLRENNPSAFQGKASDADYYDGLYGVIRNIAADGKHGKFDDVEQMNVHNAFKEIVESIREAKELEASINRQTT